MSAMAGPAWSCVRGGGLGWPAWVNTNAYHYTSAFRDYEERRRQTEIYIQLVCFELLSYNKWWVMYACCRSFITHSASFLHPSSPPPCPVASGRFHRHYWNVDTEDDVTKLSGTERGAEIIDGGGGVGGNVGVGWWLGGGIWHISLCWCPGLLAQDTDCWGLGSGCYAWCCFSLCLFGYNSPEQDDVIHRDLWTFLIKRQNHGGEPNVARVWTGQRTIPLLFMGGSIFIAYKLQIL